MRPPSRFLGAAILSAVTIISASACSSSTSKAAEQTSSESSCPRKADCVPLGIGEPIFIGIQLSENIAIGQESIVGVELAIDYLDGQFDGVPGTIDGHKVIVLSTPDTCSGSTDGARAARGLLAEKRLIGVIGTTCSGSALQGAAEKYSDSKVLLLSPSNTAPALTGEGTRPPYYFRFANNDLISRAVTAAFISERPGWSSVATIADIGDPYSNELADSLGKQLRVNGVVTTKLASASGVDAAALVAQLALLAPKAIFIPTINPGCANITAALRNDARTRTIPIIVGDGCQEESTLAGIGANTNDLFATGLDLSVLASNDFYRTYFQPAFVRKTGVAPTTGYEANAFDAANLLVSSISTAIQPGERGSSVINRVAARNALLKVANYSGISGQITCIPSGDCIPSARIGLYQAPFWPAINPTTAQIVYSKEVTLLSVRADR